MRKEKALELENEALKVIEEAERRNILLRLFGSVAVRIHAPQHSFILNELGRIPKDMDFICEKQVSPQTEKLFSDLGYDVDKYALVISEGKRLLFKNKGTGVEAEIIVDPFEFCHRLHLKNRLKIDFPTIPLADLMLTKLQMVEITEGDILDGLVLLLEHEIDRNDRENIDSGYAARILAKNWGFYHTVTLNLRKMEERAKTLDAIDETMKQGVIEKISRFQKRIDSEDKDLKWKLRSLLGEKIRWYSIVD